jgi:hypothetical protein
VRGSFQPLFHWRVGIRHADGDFVLVTFATHVRSRWRI